MNADQAVEWLAANKDRHISSESLQKATLARLDKYGLSRNKGLYYPL
jgi:hypothetical protein